MAGAQPDEITDKARRHSDTITETLYCDEFNCNNNASSSGTRKTAYDDSLVFDDSSDEDGVRGGAGGCMPRLAKYRKTSDTTAGGARSKSADAARKKREKEIVWDDSSDDDDDNDADKAGSCPFFGYMPARPKKKTDGGKARPSTSATSTGSQYPGSSGDELDGGDVEIPDTFGGYGKEQEGKLRRTFSKSDLKDMQKLTEKCQRRTGREIKKWTGRRLECVTERCKDPERVTIELKICNMMLQLMQVLHGRISFALEKLQPERRQAALVFIATRTQDFANLLKGKFNKKTVREQYDQWERKPNIVAHSLRVLIAKDTDGWTVFCAENMMDD